MRFRGVFAGSGSDALAEPAVCDAIIALTGKEASKVNVAYLGTATYDLSGPAERQTGCFARAGCSVTSVPVGGKQVATGSFKETFESADVIVVSGGNTLFAVDRWKMLGIDVLLRQAAERGAVLAGGSAGAICWFDGGHSDSMDPASYQSSMLQLNVQSEEEVVGALGQDTEGTAPKDWQYIRIPALGFFPGLLCPHYDKVQSNGLLRAHDFDAMMLRHPGERGLCLDHWAVLIVEGHTYRQLPMPGKPGSLLPDQSFSPTQAGRPAIWLKEVDVQAGTVRTTLAPTTGHVSDLLRAASAISQDPRVELCRTQNPSTL